MATAPDSPDPAGRARPVKRGGRMRDLAAVEEVPVWLEINGSPAVTWMCTPEMLEELAIGWLFGEGYLDDLSQLKLRPCATDLGFWADLDPGRVAGIKAENRRPVLASGCGAVATYLGDPALLERGEPADPPAAEVIRALLKELFQQGVRYRDTGGIHAAALTDGAVLVTHAEDIGRHNAVDKAIGSAILGGHAVVGLGLLVTGRISGELAFKAARAGLAWVATPSVPSTMALEIAGHAGLVLVGRAASGNPHLHRPHTG